MEAIKKYPELFADNDHDYGGFDYEGRHYTLVLQQAYCTDDCFGDLVYVADAICAQDEIDDEEGVPCYAVMWYPTEQGLIDSKEYDDESLACDWENPDEVRETGVYWLDLNRIV